VAAGYGVIHDLYCEILYDRVPPTRKRRWHLQIGDRKEIGYGAQAGEIAAELGGHFVHGRDPCRAVQYLQYAGEHALQCSAPQEAVTHLTQAMALLARWPETLERAQRELRLQTALGPALMVTKGFGHPEVGLGHSDAGTRRRGPDRASTRAGSLTTHWHVAFVGRVSGPAGGGVGESRPTGGRAGGPGQGPGAGKAHGCVAKRRRVPWAQRRPPVAGWPSARGHQGLLSPGPDNSSWPTGQVQGAAGGAAPESMVAAPGQAGRSLPGAGGGLPLVSRGL
jgi:hypothetical protein